MSIMSRLKIKQGLYLCQRIVVKIKWHKQTKNKKLVGQNLVYRVSGPKREIISIIIFVQNITKVQLSFFEWKELQSSLLLGYQFIITNSLAYLCFVHKVRREYIGGLLLYSKRIICVVCLAKCPVFDKTQAPISCLPPSQRVAYRYFC